MGKEREIKRLAPALARYLGSLDTRNKYLRDYRNIQILVQDEQEDYYTFKASGRNQEDRIRMEVFLSKNGVPYYSRLRRYNDKWSVGDIDIAERKDFETVIQGKLRKWGSRIDFLFSIRSHQRKNRGGIHCVWDDDGQLDGVEFSTPQGTMVTCAKFRNSDETYVQYSEYSQVLDRTILSSEDISKVHGEAAITDSVLNCKVTNDADGTVFSAQVVTNIDPEIYQDKMDVPDNSWVNIFKQLPFKLEIATINPESKKQDNMDDFFNLDQT